MRGVTGAILRTLVCAPAWLAAQPREEPVRFVVAGDTIAGTLALFGGADSQVVPDENVPALQKAMAGGANAPLVVSVVPEATHFLRAPRTPRGQFAAGVVDTLVSWLRGRGVLR